MSTISLKYYGGLLRPSSTCQIASSQTVTSDQLEYNTMLNDKLNYEGWKKLKERYDQMIPNTPDFWRRRIVSHIAVAESQFHSVTFIPKNSEVTQIWFVQKGEGPCRGFYGSFLTSEAQAHFGCIDKPDQIHKIENEMDIVLSILNLEPVLRCEIGLLLCDFWEDPLSSGVCFTFTQELGNTTTWCWLK